jgi:hypothetical protein
MRSWKVRVLFLTVVGAAFCALAQGAGSSGSARTLPPEAQSALIEALAGEDGEYAVRAKYTAIVEKFGAVQPYAHIKMIEGYQITALETQFKNNGIALPPDRHAGKVIPPSTLMEAATMAIRAEGRSVALYERLLKSVAGQADILRVFQNLQRSSREAHLPALKAAAESGGSLTLEQIRARNWMRRAPRTGS